MEVLRWSIEATRGRELRARLHKPLTFGFWLVEFQFVALVAAASLRCGLVRPDYLAPIGLEGRRPARDISLAVAAAFLTARCSAADPRARRREWLVPTIFHRTLFAALA